ncbi:uncharacterized protein LOC135394261 isoform X2 [Ornithodoros turicata]|uniref:uncharacterized protein LOC135394261 isoform X2 n=1 Tax=Ornithodoros turicata TaxID=34597 RepID=UPI00313A3E04
MHSSEGMSTSTGEQHTSKGVPPLSQDQLVHLQGETSTTLRRGATEEGSGNPFLLMSQDQMLKLDAVLSPEQVRALLQETTPVVPVSATDKLDFDVLGNVGHSDDGSHALATIDDTFRDLETLVLEQGAPPGLFAGTTEAEVEALLKATLDSDELSAIDLVLLDHTYCLPHPVAPSDEQHEELSHEDSDNMVDEEEAMGCGTASEMGSPGSPALPLRRSQRQIEKIDRERLERIKAENAELKRREQEEMERSRAIAAGLLPPGGEDLAPATIAAVTQSPIAPPPPTSPAAHPVPAAVQEKAAKVLPHVASPTKRTKSRSSDSVSSEGAAEDQCSPTLAEEPPPQKKRMKQEAADEKGAKRPVETSPPKVKKEGQRPKKEGGVETATPSPAKRKTMDGTSKDADGLPRPKKKKTTIVLEQPEDNSPFGKVVKVVRPSPEQQKKRLRRESCSISDEPALFSQPDVLMKEGEAPPVAAAVPPTVTASAPAVAAKGEDMPGHDEHSYDSVEAHVARLAGVDSSDISKLGTSQHPAPAMTNTSPAVTKAVLSTKLAPANTSEGAPNIPKKQPVTMPVRHESKLERKKSVDGAKPTTGLKPEPGKAPAAKMDVVKTVGIKSEGVKQNVIKMDRAKQIVKKPNAMRPPGVKTDTLKPEGASMEKAKLGEKSVAKQLPKGMLQKISKMIPKVGKTGSQVERIEQALLKKPTEVEKPKKPKLDPVQLPILSERPLRQSKEKFKRAMMRKKEMGRRVDDEDIDEDEDPDDTDWSSEDDPERLWCICRQPHNDKFMIQCDRCEDWFHGHCVGVTRQQGRMWEREGREWVCPKCPKDAGGPGLKKIKQEKPLPPKAIKTEPVPAKPQKGTIRECLVCKRRTECVGLYCGRDCIAKYVNDATQAIKEAKLEGERRLMFTERGSGKLVPGVAVPTPEKLTEWLVRNPTYELAVARSAPPKPSPSKAPTSKTVPSSKVAPITGNMQNKTTPTSQAKVAAATSTTPKGPVQSKPSTVKVSTGKSVQPQASVKMLPTVTVIGGSGGGVSAENGSIDKGENVGGAATVQPEPDPPKKPEIEPVRINVRKMLRDSLSSRCKEADDVKLASDEIKRIAIRIEEELFKYFKDTGTKYKSKYRSLVFNIKDTRNQGLFRKIVRGKISPDKLVRMTPEELASKELARWRERENQHALEMIKKDQLEAAKATHALIKKTHKGEVEIDDDNNLSLLEKVTEKVVPDPPEIVTNTSTPTTPRVSVGGGTPATGTVSTDSDRSGRDTTDDHRSHLFDLNCKICTGKVPSVKGQDDELVTASPPQQHVAADSPGGTPPPPPQSHSKISGGSKQKKLKEDSDHEPSSTVSLGSPDSGISKRSSQLKAQPSVWKGFISMQEVSKFVTSAYKVSGPTDFLAQDIPDTINVCGRIIPDQVWDYLGKIKQSGNKELLVIRFQPANDEEKRPYKELYSYLNSRKRCGVVGGLTRMLKDFYIHPLPSHSPVPTVLMPFDGPGLMSNRPNLLLGIIIRHKSRPKGPGKSKSSWTADRSEPSYTPPQEGGTASDDDEPYEPSYTPPLEKRPKRAAAVPSSHTPPVEDDEPYDPEDNDFGSNVDGSSRDGGTVGSSTPLLSGQTVSDLIERISAGANPAEVTSSVLASLASNSDLEHQKRLLMELTQEVEEQKRLIELQRQQAIRMAMGRGTAGTSTAAVVPSPPAKEASGIPFLDNSLSTTSTGLSFLSSAPSTKEPAQTSGSCSLPSTLQELLNKVKAPTLPSTVVPQPSAAPKKPIADDPIVKHFARDATPESDVEVPATNETPPPPGVAVSKEEAPEEPPSSSPGTPTKDELVVEDTRPQDPRRRKAAAAQLAQPPVAGQASTTPSTSTLGTKSASELMEMARKQLEELEGVAPPPAQQPPPGVYNPAMAPPHAPQPVGDVPPPFAAPPPMMQPPPRMFAPPPMDPPMGYPPPHPGPLPPPPEQQWGGGDYWKGNSWGGSGDWARGNDWRGGRRGWDQRH